MHSPGEMGMDGKAAVFQMTIEQHMTQLVNIFYSFYSRVSVWELLLCFHSPAPSHAGRRGDWNVVFMRFSKKKRVCCEVCCQCVGGCLPQVQ